MYEKKGYLLSDYKLFHINDRQERTYEFHYHDFYKIVFFIKGHVTYSIEGKTYELSDSNVVFVGMNEIHRPEVFGDRDYERIVLYLSQSFLSTEPILLDSFKAAKESGVDVLKLPAGKFMGILELLNKAKANEGMEYSGELRARLLVSEALLEVSEYIRSNGMIYNGNMTSNSEVVKMCEYINTHLKEDLSVERLALLFNRNKYSFMRLFKAYTGCNVHSYITRKRLALVKELADSGEKITFACLEAGFASYSVYLRAKKRIDEADRTDNTDL